MIEFLLANTTLLNTWKRETSSNWAIMFKGTRLYNTEWFSYDLCLPCRDKQCSGVFLGSYVKPFNGLLPRRTIRPSFLLPSRIGMQLESFRKFGETSQFSTPVLAASRASGFQRNSYHYLPLTLRSSCQKIAQTLPRNPLKTPQRQTLPRRAATESQRSLLLRAELDSLLGRRDFVQTPDLGKVEGIGSSRNK